MAQTRRRNSRRRRKQTNPARRFTAIIIVIALVCVAGYFIVMNFGKAQRFIGSKLYPIKYSEYVDKASEEYGVKKAYYGHIHGSQDVVSPFVYEGISFCISSADHIGFTPLLVR